MDLKIKIQSRDEKIKAQIIGNKIWCHWNGETYVFDLFENKKRSNNSKTSNNSLEILSPMPGKVTKVFFKTGDKVEKGQAVLVMEAMKMEYTLKAETTAIVAEVRAQVNQQVSLGEQLVRFEDQKQKE